MKRCNLLWWWTSRDALIFGVAACAANENHVESSGAEGEEETRRDTAVRKCWIVIRLASPLSSPRATRRQTSWQGQPTPAEMSQCRGGNTGHADFLCNLLFIQGKSAECAATGPNNHSPPLRCSRWGLPASIVPISALCKKREHYSFFPEPDFQKSQARWIRSRRPSSYKPHGQAQLGSHKVY